MRLTQQQVHLRLTMFVDACKDFERDLPQVWRQLKDGQVGFPASTLGGGTGGGDVSDPVGRAAMQPDPAARALDWLSELACYLEATARELDRVRREWRPYTVPPKPCGNPWCGSPAAPSRATCEACRKFKERHGVHRGSPQALAMGLGRVPVSQPDRQAG